MKYQFTLIFIILSLSSFSTVFGFDASSREYVLLIVDNNYYFQVLTDDFFISKYVCQLTSYGMECIASSFNDYINREVLAINTTSKENAKRFLINHMLSGGVVFSFDTPELREFAQPFDVYSAYNNGYCHILFPGVLIDRNAYEKTDPKDRIFDSTKFRQIGSYYKNNIWYIQVDGGGYGYDYYYFPNLKFLLSYLGRVKLPFDVYSMNADTLAEYRMLVQQPDEDYLYLETLAKMKSTTK